MWLNALWPFFNDSHDDDRAVHDPEGANGWLIATGASIIQTDRPGLLIDYLSARGQSRAPAPALPDPPAASDVGHSACPIPASPHR